MNIKGVAIGDLVEIEQLGRGRCYAVALGRDSGKLEVQVIGGAVRFASARELVGVWRRSGRTPMPTIVVDRELLAREAS